MDKTFGQQVALIFAIISVAAGTGCGIWADLIHPGVPYDPARAALMASVVFFYGCALVLRAIYQARLKGLLSLPR